MTNELEIIKRLNLCSSILEEKIKFKQDFLNLPNEKQQDFLIIMKNLKETFVIRNLEIVENENGSLVDFNLLAAPYLTGLGEKYLKAKESN